MKYYLENAKRYLVYMFVVIRNEIVGYDSTKRLGELYNTLPIHTQRAFKLDLGLAQLSDSKIMLNNKWGQGKLKKGETYYQNVVQQPKLLGWSYQVPNKNRGVIGFPEIFTGKSPFGGESLDPKFPKLIKNINNAEAAYDVSMYIEPKKYNLVFDLWITGTKEARVTDITNEIMIWEDRNVAKPAGKYIKTITTSFGTYRIYSGWMDRTSEKLGTNGWMFTAFVRQDRRRSGLVNFKEILDIMKSEKILNDKYYLATVEFGTEVYNSNGYVVVNSYDLTVE